MADPDGIWRYHVMTCPGGWKIVVDGRTLSVHSKKGSALSAAERARLAKNKAGLRAGVLNYLEDGTVREHFTGGPRKTRGSGVREDEPVT